MCTLGVLLGTSDRFPLIVAANRDEAYDRPATGPSLWDSSPRIVAGKDLRAGGTWLGVNEHGVLAGLTNLFSGKPADATRRSRGEIVRGLLAARTLEAAQSWCATLQAADFNPFLAICATRSGHAFWIQSRDELEIHPLQAGVHAFGNSPPADADPKPGAAGRALREALGAAPDHEPSTLVAAFQPVLAEHRGNRGPRESVCVHGEHGYGTVSSSIYLLGERSHCLHAAGAPCVTEFRDYSELMEQLFGSARG